MAIRPILCHYFPIPLPYLPTLQVQQTIHQWQLNRRRESSDLHHDVILALQHRPVYTTGRRQTEDETFHEMERLTKLGADFVRTKRGGQTTYHGPGQLVIYPLIDLGRHQLSVKDYICLLQRSITKRLKDHHDVDSFPSEHTGVFLDANRKVASIGVEIRHRLTLHGLALNVTAEPKAWFDQVVACGLTDVKAGSLSDASRHGDSVSVRDEALGLMAEITSALGWEALWLDSDLAVPKIDGQSPDTQVLTNLVLEIHELASQSAKWATQPRAIEEAPIGGTP